MRGGKSMNGNAIKEVENTWITMQDGTRLAARIWMPENSEKNPVPCIFEYIPYRKRDFTSERDEGMHKYFPTWMAYIDYYAQFLKS